MHVIYTPSGARGKKKKGTDSLRKSNSKSSLCEEKKKSPHQESIVRYTIWADESTKYVHFQGSLREKSGKSKHAADLQDIELYMLKH